MAEVPIIKDVELTLFQVSISALFQVSLLYDRNVRHERVKCSATTRAVALIRTKIRKISINDTIINWYHKISNIGQIKADFQLIIPAVQVLTCFVCSINYIYNCGFGFVKKVIFD